MSGRPPEGHPRQCQAITRIKHWRCRRWALKGSKYCQFHGGRRAQASGIKDQRHLGKYSIHLGKTLSERIANLLDEQPTAQLALFEELALARVSCGEAIKLFDLSQTSVDSTTKTLACELMRDSLLFVRDMAIAASKIEHDAQDKISVGVFDLVVSQVCRAIHKACKDDELAAAIEIEIRKTVRFPKLEESRSPDGTVLTPDMTVQEMDSVTTGEDDECDE